MKRSAWFRSARFAAGVCVALPFVSFAVDGVWINEDDASASWETTTNWRNGSVPADAASSATLNVPTGLLQTVSLAEDSNKKFTIGTLSGSMYHRVGAKPSTAFGPEAHAVQIGDMSGYAGSFYVSRTMTTVSFSGDAPDVKVADFSANLRPILSVPTNTVVELQSVYGGGAIDKKGAGKVIVGNAQVGDSLVVYQAAGTVELNGHSAETGVRPAGTPVFWVDASKTNLMDIAHEGDRDYVATWHDCRTDDGVHVLSATARSTVKRPWIADKTVGGLPLLDFGQWEANGTKASELGQSAAMQYDIGVKAREIFIVMQQKPASVPFFIGQARGSAVDFHRGDGNTLLHTSLAHANVRNGIIRMDGRDAAVSTVPDTTSLHIIDYGMVGDGLSPSTFCSDRTSARDGGAYVAEALFYTNELTHAERAQTTAYLHQKWFGGEADVEALFVASDATPVSVPSGRAANARQVVIGGGKLVKQGDGLLKVGRFQTNDALAPDVEVRGGGCRFRCCGRFCLDGCSGARSGILGRRLFGESVRIRRRIRQEHCKMEGLPHGIRCRGGCAGDGFLQVSVRFG